MPDSSPGNRGKKSDSLEAKSKIDDDVIIDKATGEVVNALASEPESRNANSSSDDDSTQESQENFTTPGIDLNYNAEVRIVRLYNKSNKLSKSKKKTESRPSTSRRAFASLVDMSDEKKDLNEMSDLEHVLRYYSQKLGMHRQAERVDSDSEEEEKPKEKMPAIDP